MEITSVFWLGEQFSGKRKEPALMAEWKELCPPPTAEMVWVIFWGCLEQCVACCRYRRQVQESEPTGLPQPRETPDCSPAEWCH